MAKKIVLVILALAIGLASYIGLEKYREYRNTPEAVMASFMEDLSLGKPAKTYERFSDRYAAKYPESDWQSFAGSLKGATGLTVVSQESINDQFNTYVGLSSPQRFGYNLQVKGRQYRATAVILKQDRSWKIDDFQGSYK